MSEYWTQYYLSEQALISDQKLQLGREQRDWDKQQEQLQDDNDESVLQVLKNIADDLRNLSETDHATVLPKLLEQVTKALDSCIKLRYADFKFLIGECKVLFSACLTSFKTRETNHTWWNRTVVFYHRLVQLVGPVGMSEVFPSAVLSPLLLSLSERPAQRTHHDRPLIVETTRLVWEILASVVGRNALLAYEVEQLGMTDTLSRIPPLEELDPHYVADIAFFVSQYVKKLPPMCQQTDEIVYCLLHKFLMLDPEKYEEAIITGLDGLAAIQGDKYNSYPAWECAMLASLIDLSSKCKVKFTPKMDHNTSEFLNHFTAAVSRCTSTNSMLERQNMKLLLNDSFWTTACGRIFDEFETSRASNEPVIKIAQNIICMWHNVCRRKQEVKFDLRVPSQIAMLVVQYSVWVSANQGRLCTACVTKDYLENAGYDELNDFLDKQNILLSKWTNKLRLGAEPGTIVDIELETKGILRLADFINKTSDIIQKVLKTCPGVTIDGSMGTVKPLFASANGINQQQ